MAPAPAQLIFVLALAHQAGHPGRPGRARRHRGHSGGPRRQPVYDLSLITIA